MSLSGGVQLFAQDILSTNSAAQHPVGTLGFTTDGRKYRYAKAGGGTLAVGKLAVAAVSVDNHTNEAVAVAAAVGDTSVTITLGSTLATADQYAGGYLTINNEAGEGISYLVSGHPAADSAASLVVTLFKSSSIQVALTTSSKATLSKNPWDGVVISVTDQLDMPVGVPNVAITNAEFGWLQTHGVCATFADETLAIGAQLTTGTGVAGAVEVIDAAGEPSIGYAFEAGVDDEYHAIYLTID